MEDEKKHLPCMTVFWALRGCTHLPSCLPFFALSTATSHCEAQHELQLPSRELGKLQLLEVYGIKLRLPGEGGAPTGIEHDIKLWAPTAPGPQPPPAAALRRAMAANQRDRQAARDAYSEPEHWLVQLLAAQRRR